MAKIAVGIIYDGFNENKYSTQWIASATAFGTGPDITNSTFHLGIGYVNTYTINAHDSTTGTRTAKPFTIEKGSITFLTGGRNYAGQTCINLLVNNCVVTYR